MLLGINLEACLIMEEAKGLDPTLTSPNVRPMGKVCKSTFNNSQVWHAFSSAYC